MTSPVVAKRMASIPAYAFADIDRRVSSLQASGVDVIRLDVGDPDLPPPDSVVDTLRSALDDPSSHRYPSYFGRPETRKAIADWYVRRFGVELDPDGEVLPVLGSKDGISHVALALANPGDTVLVPDPGYAIYAAAAVLAGAEPVRMPLTESNRWLPDLTAIDRTTLQRASIMWLNYPHNPTGAVAPAEFFAAAVALCREHNIVLCHDAPYSEIWFDQPALSVLQTPGAKDVALEFHSVSKTFNMAGWRFGWLSGSRALVSAVKQLKTNVDSGIFPAIQAAAVAALTAQDAHVDANREVYRARHDLVVQTLNGLGWTLRRPAATLYVWAPVPRGHTSVSFVTKLLDDAAVSVTPGAAFGPAGEGYFRISVTTPDKRLEEAMARLSRLTI